MLRQLNHRPQLRVRLRFQGELAKRLAYSLVGYGLRFVEYGFDGFLGAPHDFAVIVAPPKGAVPNEPALERVNVADIFAMSGNEAMTVPKFGPLLAALGKVSRLPCVPASLGTAPLIPEPLRDMLGDVLSKRFGEDRESPRLAAFPMALVPRIARRLSDVFDFLPRLAACDRDGFGKQFRVRPVQPASKEKSAECHSGVMPGAFRREVGRKERR
jgi:hypothetical protein